MKSVIVLPTYNESGNLERLVHGILAVQPDIDVLVIDDSSPDGTGEIADRLASQNFRVAVIHRPRKSGRGSATAAGFKYAVQNGYDYVLEIDCDLSHNPDDIPRLLAAAEDADLVIASRFVKGGSVEGWNWRRWLIHFMADMSVKAILGTPNTDHTNGFRCYRVSALKNVNFERLAGVGYVGQTLLENVFYKFGFRIKEVPCAFRLRGHGRSKMGRREMIGGLRAMLKLRMNYIRRGREYYRHSDKS